MNFSIIKAIKITFFLLAIVIFFLVSNPLELINFLSKQDFYIVFNSLIILILSYLIYALRWSVLVCIATNSKDYLRFLSSYMISLFYNSFTPANIGGDAYRLVKDSSNELKKTQILALLLMERMVGLLIFLFFSLIIFREIEAFIFNDDLKYIYIFLFVIILSLITLNINFFKLKIFKFMEKLGFFGDSINLFIKHIKNLRLVFISFILSVVGVLLSVIAFQIILKSNNFEINFISLLGIFCAIEIIRVIPISYQGFGFRESFFAFVAFSTMNASVNDAIYLSGFYYILVSFALALTGFSSFILNNIIESIIYSKKK